MTMAIPVASYIDHTLLKATCRSADIINCAGKPLNSNLQLFVFPLFGKTGCGRL